MESGGRLRDRHIYRHRFVLESSHWQGRKCPRSMGWWPGPERIQRGLQGRFGCMHHLVLLQERPILRRARRRPPLGAGHSSVRVSAAISSMEEEMVSTACILQHIPCMQLDQYSPRLLRRAPSQRKHSARRSNKVQHAAYLCGEV